MARIINSSLDIDEVYERFAREVSKVISFERISITEIDRATATYKLLYVSGKEVWDRPPGAVVPLRGLLHRASGPLGHQSAAAHE